MANENIFTTLGASNHAKEEREKNDFYATDNIAAHLLLENEPLKNIWECACGDGELAKVFDKAGVLGKASDLINRGYGEAGIDFLKYSGGWDGDIVTNPPYKHAEAFVRRAYEIIQPGRKVCMFLRLLFLESKGRQALFEECPLKTVYVSRKRIPAYKNNNQSNKSSAIAFCWFVWEKGYSGEPVIKWIN